MASRIGLAIIGAGGWARTTPASSPPARPSCGSSSVGDVDGAAARRLADGHRWRDPVRRSARGDRGTGRRRGAHRGLIGPPSGDRRSGGRRQARTSCARSRSRSTLPRRTPSSPRSNEPGFACRSASCAGTTRPRPCSGPDRRRRARAGRSSSTAASTTPIRHRRRILDPRISGGIMLDMGIHEFDSARFLMGSEVVELQATGSVQVYPEAARPRRRRHRRGEPPVRLGCDRQRRAEPAGRLRRGRAHGGPRHRGQRVHRRPAGRARIGVRGPGRDPLGRRRPPTSRASRPPTPTRPALSPDRSRTTAGQPIGRRRPGGVRHRDGRPARPHGRRDGQGRSTRGLAGARRLRRARTRRPGAP